MDVNEPETVRMTVYIPIELDTEMRVAAARRRTSMSAIAIEAFEAYVAKQSSPVAP